MLIPSYSKSSPLDNSKPIISFIKAKLSKITAKNTKNLATGAQDPCIRYEIYPRDLDIAM